MNSSRLPPYPTQEVDPTQKVTFSFAGKKISAYASDTIAAALYSAGMRIFSRSFKYHRPRGLLCFSGKCPNCLMNVDGTPNVRTCLEPVREGMRVHPQNAWPSLQWDALAVIDKFDRLLPIGFYYKTFIRPRFVWPLAEQVLRRIAGLGKVDRQAEPKGGYDHQYRHTDVAVVGGGPAGLCAAREAAHLGARVTLIDDQPALGGHLRVQTGTYTDGGEYSGWRGFDIARRLAQEIESLPGVEVIRPATAFGCYEGGLLGVMQGKRLIHLRTKRLVVATGCYEYPLVFPNNDLPGVMLASGVQRLLYLYRVKPGNCALVVTNNNFGLTLACDLLAAGVKVAAVVDARALLPEGSDPVEKLKAAGVPLLTSHLIREARGRKQVTGAIVAPLEEQGHAQNGAGRYFSCDLICLSTGFAPAGALLSQSGCRSTYDPALGEIVPQEMAANVFAAGDVSGVHHLPAILLQGQIAGMRAALSLDLPEADNAGDRCTGYQQELAEVERQYHQRVQTRPLVSSPQAGKKKFVCLCEDVTEKDLGDGVAEGFDEIETLKRYSTISMGPCQGKMCAMALVGLCAKETGRSIEEIGTTTARPPIQPVSLGVLAGRPYHPLKLTPLHHKHVALGAKMMDLGEWKRPYAYTSPAEEYQAVRERVGLIDVSTLGKLDIKGRDAARLLDRVYTHIFSTLRVGRVRYGVMCDDSGVVLDDGTVSRLADDHFFITTTTGNIEFVEQWLKWWAAGTGMCVHITNVTSGLAAVNLAGPQARVVLGKLTERDLSPEGFPYLACGQGEVAGVPTLLLRIGFVGESGWEMHFPAEYGEHVWDTLIEAGKEAGIAPFGVEAQRILRLEKKHLIVGQDTDALSNPLEADMAWVVKFDKEDFIGKKALVSIQQRGRRQSLVGFVMRDTRVAEDGSAVVVSGKPVGRVASSRFSPSVGKGVGLAWVPIEMAADGTPLQIRVNGTLAVADIVSQPFYDPQGKRLRA
jgi:sarcosine oxidase subunit alpha